MILEIKDEIVNESKFNAASALFQTYGHEKMKQKQLKIPTHT